MSDAKPEQVQRGAPQSGIPPHLKLVFGKWVSMLLDAVVRLGVPDLLADGQPRTADDLAAKCGAHPDRLYRAMRALTNDGVFVEHEGRRFTLGEQGQFFRKDHPMSAAATAVWIGGPENSRPWLHISDCLTGESGSIKAYGGDLFDYFARDSAALCVFQSCMTELARQAMPGIIQGYKEEWSKFNVICDVGGGHGFLLAEAVKAAGENARGILYDRPEVTAEAPKLLQGTGVGSRIECRDGDFFQSVPKGVDLFMMKYIIHDHDDDKCIKILKNCRDNLNPKGRVLIIDAVVPGPNEPAVCKLLDIEMFVQLTGRERTESEFARLLEAAGLRLSRVMRMGMIDMVEAMPADTVTAQQG